MFGGHCKLQTVNPRTKLVKDSHDNQLKGNGTLKAGLSSSTDLQNQTKLGYIDGRCYRKQM
jgi:hypothetical protein